MKEGDDEVWLVVYIHKHGEEYSVCSSPEVADALVMALARDNFSKFENGASEDMKSLISAAICEEDVDDIYANWRDFTDLVESFERLGPMRILEG